MNTRLEAAIKRLGEATGAKMLDWFDANPVNRPDPVLELFEAADEMLNALRAAEDDGEM